MYFDTFLVQHSPNEIKKFIGNKNIIRNIFTTQVHGAIMCRHFCIWFNDFMVKGKSLLDYSNIFSPNDYKKINQIILKHFQ